MKTVRALIADDEKPARERLRLYLRDIPEIEVIAEAANGAQALEIIRAMQPALVFLDVQMPVLSGFELLRQLDTRPAVIFTTAYDEYALRAFEVHAVDYLLKPYGKDRLRDAVEHALSSIERGSPSAGPAGLSALLADESPPPAYISRISAKRGRAYRVFSVERADFFKAEDGLVFLVEGRERHQVDGTLAELETRLDPAAFMRVHRNAIANLRKVARVISLGGGRLAAEFASGERIGIGRSRSDDFRRSMSLGR